MQVAQFAVEEGACHPARGWAQQSGGQYYPSTPRGNLFAFESEDRFVLTCAQQQALIYEVSGPQYIVTFCPQHFRGGEKVKKFLLWRAQVGQEGGLTKTLSIAGHLGPVTCVDWLHGRRSFSTCLTGSVDCSINVINMLKN